MATKKFLLIEVIQRNISEPMIFDSHPQAHKAMREKVAKAVDISIEEVNKAYEEYSRLSEEKNARLLMNGGCVNNPFHGRDIRVYKDDAWGKDINGNDVDWEIFEIIV